MVNEKCRRELDMFNFDFNGYNGIGHLIDIGHLKINWDSILNTS